MIGCHHGGEMSAIPEFSAAALFEQWYFQPVAVVVAVVAIGYYWRGLRALRRRSIPWPRGRVVLFGLGMALFVWASCGAAQVYSRALFSVWTGQLLTLLLIVPAVVMAGQPVELGRLVSGPNSLGVRFLRSPLGRTLASPLVGPVIIPVLSVLLFFGPVPGWSLAAPGFAWGLQLAVAIIGAMIVLPLVASDDDRGSLAVGLAMAIGFLELLLDAIPGIVLRLQTHLSSNYFDHRLVQSWSPTPLHDQQWGGGVLWCAAEVLDLPFLILVFRRWMRADARDAREIDSVLEAERIVATHGDDKASPAPGDQPWWLNDPTMRERFRG
jgi:cytochrome c oxidase assembly factor CtaG